MEKKKSKAGAIVLMSVLLLAGAATFVFTKTDAGYFLKCHISSEPRMTCNVILNVDNNPYALTDANVTALQMDNGAENTISDFSSDASGCSFKCKGGEYGNQPFQITFSYGDGKTAVIPVKPVIGANWEMTDLVLTINADTEAESYSYQAELLVNQESYIAGGDAAFHDEQCIRVSDI